MVCVTAMSEPARYPVSRSRLAVQYCFCGAIDDAALPTRRKRQPRMPLASERHRLRLRNRAGGMRDVAGNRKRHRRARSVVLGRPDLTTMSLDDGATDGQTHPHAI